MSIEQWCEYMGKLTGHEPKFNYTDQTLESVIPDLTKMNGLIGETRVDWQEGIRRMLEARYPEIQLRET